MDRTSCRCEEPRACSGESQHPLSPNTRVYLVRLSWADPASSAQGTDGLANQCLPL